MWVPTAPLIAVLIQSGGQRRLFVSHTVPSSLLYSFPKLHSIVSLFSWKALTHFKKWSHIEPKSRLTGFPDTELLFHSTKVSNSLLSVANTYFISLRFCCLPVSYFFFPFCFFFSLILIIVETECNKSRTAVAIRPDHFNGSMIPSHMNFLSALSCLSPERCTNVSPCAVSVHFVLHLQKCCIVMNIKNIAHLTNNPWISKKRSFLLWWLKQNMLGRFCCKYIIWTFCSLCC